MLGWAGLGKRDGGAGGGVFNITGGFRWCDCTTQGAHALPQSQVCPAGRRLLTPPPSQWRPVA